VRAHAEERDLYELTARFRRLVIHLALLLANPTVPDFLGVQMDDEAGST
jgi:hypothetical protein